MKQMCTHSKYGTRHDFLSVHTSVAVLAQVRSYHLPGEGLRLVRLIQALWGISRPARATHDSKASPFPRQPTLKGISSLPDCKRYPGKVQPGALE